MINQDFKTMVLFPGEILVLKSTLTVEKKEAKKLKEKLKKYFPDNDVIILDNNTDMVGKITLSNSNK
jgi:hypothetical protein